MAVAPSSPSLRAVWAASSKVLTGNPAISSASVSRSLKALVASRTRTGTVRDGIILFNACLNEVKFYAAFLVNIFMIQLKN